MKGSGGIEATIGKRETMIGGGDKTPDRAHQCVAGAASEIADARSGVKIAMRTVDIGGGAVLSTV